MTEKIHSYKDVAVNRLQNRRKCKELTEIYNTYLREQKTKKLLEIYYFYKEDG